MRCAVDVPAFMIHTPPCLLLSGRPEALRGGEWDSDGGVGSGLLALRATQVVEHRPELGLHARAVLFGGLEQRLPLVCRRLELHVLRDAIQVAEAGALERKRLLPGLSGPVVANQAVGALLQRVVREVGLPLDRRSLPRACWPARRAAGCRCRGSARTRRSTRRELRRERVPCASYNLQAIHRTVRERKEDNIPQSIDREGVMRLTAWPAVLLLAAAACQTRPEPTMTYPATARGDVVDDYFGTKVPDPYRWMEDLDSPAVADWVAAQNRVTFDYLEKLPDARSFQAADHRALGLPEGRASRCARVAATSIRRTAGCSGRRRCTCGRASPRSRRWCSIRMSSLPTARCRCNSGRHRRTASCWRTGCRKAAPTGGRSTYGTSRPARTSATK